VNVVKMKSKTGQTNIVGFLIITLIILVVVSGTFFWAKEMLDDSKHVSEISQIENRMIELDKAIREVVNEQSQRSIKFDIENGYLFIADNHTITFSFARNPPESFDSAGVAILGNSSSAGVCFNNNVRGILGTERSSCIIRKGREISVNYIIMNETITDNCYSVQFEGSGTGAAGKGTHEILLTYSHTNTTTECNTSYIRVVDVDIS